jgi:hypothetical protein
MRVKKRGRGMKDRVDKSIGIVTRITDVATMMTPALNHLLCFNLCRCAEKVSKLINRPVVSLLVTRVSGTGTEMITQCIYLKFPSTTSLNRLLRNHLDLSAH